MKEYLGNLGIVDPRRVEKIADGVRDREGFTVWRCPVSGVIFLEGPIDDGIDRYRNKIVEGAPDFAHTRTLSGLHTTLWVQDDVRRAEQFADRIRGRDWLDFGAGEGGLVRLLMPMARSALACEANLSQCERMKGKGIPLVEDWRSLADESLDVLTLFHVFEHLSTPVELLAELVRKVRPGGIVILEVPHARDFLLGHLDCEPFRRFTLWSEHLILHSRASLEAMLRMAGLERIATKGFQRYPLSNHLYWLRHGKPGGHDHWSFLETEDLKRSYAAMLVSLDQTDTLIAECHKPAAPGGK